MRKKPKQILIIPLEETMKRQEAEERAEEKVKKDALKKEIVIKKAVNDYSSKELVDARLKKYMEDVINNKDSDDNSLSSKSQVIFSENIFKAIHEYADENNLKITGDGSINLDHESNY